MLPGDVARFRLGSVLHGGGSEAGRGDLAAWSEAVARFQREAVEDTRLGIPISALPSTVRSPAKQSRDRPCC